MFNIKLNAKDAQDGKVVYNAGIVHNIVALAIAEVEGAVLVQGKKNGISDLSKGETEASRAVPAHFPRH